LKRGEKGGRRTCNEIFVVFGADTPIKGFFFSFLENGKLEGGCGKEENERCGGIFIFIPLQLLRTVTTCLRFLYFYKSHNIAGTQNMI
jgi:hypothetical protein